MSGETDWMSLGEWVAALRQLHEQARQGTLPQEELRRYHEERETLARAILAAQRLRASPGAKGRGSLRVARELRVDLTMGRSQVQLRTLDLGQGGFAVLTPATFRVGQQASFALELAEGVSISGNARVVSLQRKGKAYRVAFRFEDLSGDAQERLGLAVFDAALAGITPKK